MLLTFTVALTGWLMWFGNVALVRHDPLFRGKPESEWIKNLKYADDEQVKEWQAYGEEGVQVLIRGLNKANCPGERAYRRFSPTAARLREPVAARTKGRFHREHAAAFGFTAF